MKSHIHSPFNNVCKTISVVLVFSLVSCLKSNNKNQTEPEPLDEGYSLFTIDSKDIKSKLYVSGIADSIIYIPLETKDETLIKQLNQYIICENDIFIADSKKVSRYSKTGKFVNHIGAVGQGPGEYIVCGGFEVDDENKRLYLHAIFEHEILIYDYSGRLTGSKRINLDYLGMSMADNDYIYLNKDETPNIPDSVCVFHIDTDSITTIPGRVTGVNKRKREIYLKKEGVLSGYSPVDTLCVIREGLVIEKIALEQRKEEEKDFFYPMLLLDIQGKRFIMGNFQREVNTYQKRWDRQLKDGRVVHWSSTDPTPKNPALYSLNNRYFFNIEISEYSELDKGITNDLTASYNFWPRFDYLFFSIYRIDVAHTITTMIHPDKLLEDIENGIIKDEKLIQLSKEIKADDNPILAVLYLK
jgi:hypothetical protein